MQKINRKIGLVIIMVLMILVVNTYCFASNIVSTRASNTASNNSDRKRSNKYYKSSYK